MGWRGPDAGHEGQHVQAASHHQGGGEEEEDREDEPHSGHSVHGLLAAIPCLLHSGILSTRYAFICYEKKMDRRSLFNKHCCVFVCVCVCVAVCVCEQLEKNQTL